MSQKVYTVIPIKNLTDSMIEESSNETSGLRRSLDGTLVLLKFDNHFPDSIQGYIKYTQSELFTYLADNAQNWSPSESDFSSKKYFKIPIGSLTQEMFNASESHHVLCVPKTKDGLYGMLSFDAIKIPIELFKLNIPSMTPTQARTELDNGNWFEQDINTIASEDFADYIILEDGSKLLSEEQ